jgi:lipopolysaccharide biosynthesis regulator YciM
MQESELKENAGQQYLVVYYDRQLKDWDRAIDLAMNRHKIKEAINILCMPRKDKRCDFINL